MTKTSRLRRNTPGAVAPRALPIVRASLNDMKAVDVREFDVRGLSDVTDYMLVASGTSDRHVKSIAERVVQSAKSAGVRPFGVEGLREGEWVLVDLPDVLVHVMLPRVRELYALEQLWAPPQRSAGEAAAATARVRSAAPGGAKRRASGKPRGAAASAGGRRPRGAAARRPRPKA
jgi:ribosome-associated protein